MPIRRVKGSWWIDIRFRNKRYRLRSPKNYREGATEYERTIISRLMCGESVHLPEDPHAQLERQRFEVFSGYWLETYVKANLAASTQAEYARTLERVLIPSFGKERLDEITSFTIERFKVARQEGGASPKTVNNDLFVLSRLLRTATEWGVLRHMAKIRYLKEDPPETDFLTMPESQRLLEHTADPMWRLFIFVALRTGLRAGELIGLRWEDIDLKARLVVIRRSIVDGIVKTTKTRRIRYVAMAWDLHSVLSTVARPTGYLFAQPGDEPIKRSTAAGALRRACKKAGLRSIGLHVLRHSFASHLVMQGQDLYSVQRLLGHSNPITTQRYAHLAPAYLRSVVDSLPHAQGGLANLVGHRVVNPWSTDGEQQANTGGKAPDSISDISADPREKEPASPVPLHGRDDRD